MLASQDCQWSLLHTPPCSDHVLGKLLSNFLALSPHVWVIKIRALLVTRTSGSMTGYWKPPSPRRKSNSTNHAEGRPKPQTDRKNCPTTIFTDFDFKYEQSGRGKNHLVSKHGRTCVLVNMWTSFNPAINFLERRKSSIWRRRPKFSYFVGLFVNNSMATDIPSWFSTEQQIQNVLSAGWLSTFNWSTDAYTMLLDTFVTS